MDIPGLELVCSTYVSDLLFLLLLIFDNVRLMESTTNSMTRRNLFFMNVP